MGLSWYQYASRLPLAVNLGKVRTATALLPEQDQKTVERIRQETLAHNRDNIDRTRAYLSFYQKHPQVHWALLAHLVSRNAGWSMTDLRGELLPRLLRAKEQQEYFSLLERGNWLIFHDAYPQLLLYEECVRRQTNLFYLLPHLGVSTFMQAIWNHFWKTTDKDILAIGLIINEQNYLEEQVMKDPAYQNSVVRTIPFALQELLQLNMILLPQQKRVDEQGSSLQLAGERVFHFASLPERISLGKRLYSLLFGAIDRQEAAYAWALDQPHTGSRKDYWPHLFHDVNETVPGKPYQVKLMNCQLRSGTKRLFSPTLRQVWRPVSHEQPKELDWYKNKGDVWRVLTRTEETADATEMSEAYCQALAKIEWAVAARTRILG
ncbi:DUF2515 domain-containing protein [Brevibacillus sp. MER 51]|uniref:DUF2515 domain-containing protein n=1 Tax=Brevibacillus sp. MER 51 TaxID=2939560 RepID=UPI002040905D|nr:DUF2515 domain-containing protein [Brevibacillus sp. MER 51]MCM3143275.1 DUF2515 domain-containing protein [Brevibacillus sp. MER 51]